jgi:hypothetical protein
VCPRSQHFYSPNCGRLLMMNHSLVYEVSKNTILIN